MIAPLRTIDPAPRGSDARAEGAAEGAAAADRVAELQSRIRGMEAQRLEGRAVPTHPALAAVLPGGALREGAVYTVEGGVSLVMATLVAASAAGRWAAVVGFDEFGIEAAERAGIALDRLVLVREPGRHWMPATAALADVIPLVAVRPGGRVAPAEASRFAARLRQRGATLIAAGEWPGPDARIRIERREWSGLGDGHGLLAEREVTVTAVGRDARVRRAAMLLPGAAGLSAPVATPSPAAVPDEAAVAPALARVRRIVRVGGGTGILGGPPPERRAVG